MSKHAYMQKAFLDRVRQDHPNAAHVVATINAIGEVLDRLETNATALENDRNLTAVGRSAKLTEIVRSQIAKEFAVASKSARKAPAMLKAQRDALGLPKIDRCDMVGELRRQELRAYVRGLDMADRMKAAFDPEIADAQFDAPRALSGLPAEIFEQAKQQRIRDLHGPKLEELQSIEDVYACASGMAGAARHAIFEKSGLTPDGFTALLRPHAGLFNALN